MKQRSYDDMLARLYGPLGMQPNSAAVELLSYRQYALLEAGHYHKHREDFSIIRGGMAEGTYEEIYGLKRLSDSSREDYERLKERVRKRNPEFFEQKHLN